MKVFLVMASNGDGSSSIEFWDADIVNQLEDDNPEVYFANEGFALELDLVSMPPYRTLKSSSDYLQSEED